MAFEPWVIVRAQCLAWIGAGDGLVEHFSHSDSIDISSVNEIAVLETRNELGALSLVRSMTMSCCFKSKFSAMTLLIPPRFSDFASNTSR